MSRREEVQEEIDNLHRMFGGHKRTISVQLEGPAIIYAEENRKKAGYPGSRGTYISRAIIYWEEQGPHALFGEVSDLRREITFLHKNIAGLQRVILHQNENNEDE